MPEGREELIALLAQERAEGIGHGRLRSWLADDDAQPEEGRCASVTLATAVAFAALQPAMLAEW